jgi:ribonuclease BN (tRNA processing enzyme)
MKVVLVPSAAGVGRPYHYLSSYVIDGVIAVDAGGLGFHGPLAEQARVRHVFLTHSHIDHLASLPLFLENVYGAHADCVCVHGSAAVLDCLQRDLFNDRVWPDFLRISRERKPAYLRTSLLEECRPVEAEGLRVTPVSVDHVVPTFAFVVEGPTAAVAVVTDTAPTEAVWERCRRTPNLKAVFLECAFPNSAAFLAGVAKHLTTDLFVRELRKAGPGVPVIAVHLKARMHDEIAGEILAHGLPNVRIAEPGKVYEF